jgi:hypothetical protein
MKSVGDVMVNGQSIQIAVDLNMHMTIAIQIVPQFYLVFSV